MWVGIGRVLQSKLGIVLDQFKPLPACKAQTQHWIVTTIAFTTLPPHTIRLFVIHFWWYTKYLLALIESPGYSQSKRAEMRRHPYTHTPYHTDCSHCFSHLPNQICISNPITHKLIFNCLRSWIFYHLFVVRLSFVHCWPGAGNARHYLPLEHSSSFTTSTLARDLHAIRYAIIQCCML